MTKFRRMQTPTFQRPGEVGVPAARDRPCKQVPYCFIGVPQPQGMSRVAYLHPLQSEKLDPEPDPLKSEKLDPDPLQSEKLDPDPH